MDSSRWLTVLAAILALNTAAVTVTSLRHLASANEQPQVSSGAEEVAEPDINAEEHRSGLSSNESPPGGVSHSNDPPSTTAPARGLEVPELSQVPAQDAEALERDPVFQEFQEMFGARADQGLLSPTEPLRGLQPDGSQEAASPVQESAASSNADSRWSESEYAACDARLAAAQKILDAARSLNAEAASSSQLGHHGEAAELKQMCAQLRQMASQLLASPR